MTLSFRGITLRQVLEDDMPFLFRLFADPERSHLWMQARRVSDEREFHQAWISWTGSSMGAKFIVESDGRPIGLVFEYDRTLEDGHAKVTALLKEESVGRGGGVIATALLVDWLFQSLPLRKIYHQVYGYNTSVLRALRKLGLAEEGVLKGDRFWNGSYWDLHIFAGYREAWPKDRERILPDWPERSALSRHAATKAPRNDETVIVSAEKDLLTTAGGVLRLRSAWQASILRAHPVLKASPCSPLTMERR
ncbi:MAG: GNAT family N-acetyltransferase [Planctomycetes bacterium]|nr:GNAT family N-acetyltransferase [Planctomycetota bacterium]